MYTYSAGQKSEKIVQFMETVLLSLVNIFLKLGVSNRRLQSGVIKIQKPFFPLLFLSTMYNVHTTVLYYVFVVVLG